MFVGFEGFFGGGHRKSIEHVNFKGSKKIQTRNTEYLQYIKMSAF